MIQNAPPLLRVAALIDLPRTPQSGGHVKCWERIASAAAHSDLPLDLTIFFSGDKPDESLGPRARLRHIPPVFSTSRLKFLPYVPDHTDIAPYHPALARELTTFDVIHTTDGFFAFARTAEKVSKKQNIPLVTSFHTDTPSYARIFTRSTIQKICAKWPVVADALIDGLKLPDKQGNAMQRKLKRHVSKCRYALVTRAEDQELAEALIGPNRVCHLRLGTDRTMFGPHRRDRETVLREFALPQNSIIVLFVGRVDIGKNIYTLSNAVHTLVNEGLPLYLIMAGQGPATDDVKKKLGPHVRAPGFIQPNDLAQLYASVDMLALSSEVEIRSMAGVEAMVSACPVLVSEKSGVANLFNRTPAMRTVESGVESWTNALRNLANDAEARVRMRLAAQDYANAHLASWRDVLAEDLYAVWKKAAE